MNDVYPGVSKWPKNSCFLLYSYGSRVDIRSTVILSKICEQILIGLSNCNISCVIEI